MLYCSSWCVASFTMGWSYFREIITLKLGPRVRRIPRFLQVKKYCISSSWSLVINNPPPPERIRRQFHLSMTFKTSTKNLVQVLGRWYSTIPQRVYPLKIHLPVTFKISTHWPIPVWILSPWWLIELNKLSLHVKH